MNYDIDAMRNRLEEAAKRDPEPDTAKKVVAALYPQLIVLRKLRWSWKKIALELGDLWDGTADTLRLLHMKDVRSRADNGSDAGPKVPKQRRVNPKATATTPEESPDGGATSEARSADPSPVQPATDNSPDAAPNAAATRGQPDLGPFAVQRDIFGDEADA